MLRICMMALIGLNLSLANAVETQPKEVNEDRQFFQVKSYKVERLTEEEVLNMPGLQDNYRPTYTTDCSNQKQEELEPSGVSLGEVVRLGKEVWKIIEDNKSVVDVESVSVSALPKGVSCWSQLSMWKIPKSDYYRVAYENMYGIEVVSVVYRLTYSYGGSFDSVGNYLANVSVSPAKIDVFPVGFNFKSTVRVGKALNIGSLQNPVAGIELSINWSVKALSQSQQSMSLFVDGTGKISEL